MAKKYQHMRTSESFYCTLNVLYVPLYTYVFTCFTLSVKTSGCGEPTSPREQFVIQLKPYKGAWFGLLLLALVDF